MNSELQLLRTELDQLAATGVQRQRFEGDVPKARAAIAKALAAGAKQPLSYALSVFNSPTPTKARADTNRSVIVNCRTCNGDRMVLFSTRPNVTSGWMKEHGLEAQGVSEEYAPCPDCNADCNTRRQGFASPDPARVRERLSRQESA